MMGRICSFLLCVVTALGASASHAQMACTMIGCHSGLDISLEGSVWPAGRYDFEIISDGKTTRCSSVLPFRGCDQPGTTCDRDGVLIGESGCAMSQDVHGFSGIQLSEVPSDFSLTITHESGKTFSFRTAVTAQCAYPNGMGCDPEPCCSANIHQPVQWQAPPEGGR